MHRLRSTALFVALAVLVAASPAVDTFEQAMLRGDYEQAVTLIEALAARDPSNAVIAYNAGCAHSRAGHADRAIEWLATAARLGFAGTRSIRDDDDLDAVREHAGFAAVRQAVEANAAARFARFRAEAEKHRPTVILPPKHDPSVAAPLLVVLHGTGGTGKGMARFWRRAAAIHGAIIVAPDALRPEPRTKGYNWVFRDESEWLVLRTIDDAKKTWKVGPVVLAGFSQGANIALMLGQSHADRFHAVIPVGGHYESDVAALPTTGPRPRWGLIIGADDPWAPTYLEADRVFTGAGMAVRREVVPRLGHAMPSGRAGSSRLADLMAWSLEDFDGTNEPATEGEGGD